MTSPELHSGCAEGWWWLQEDRLLYPINTPFCSVRVRAQAEEMRCNWSHFALSFSLFFNDNNYMWETSADVLFSLSPSLSESHLCFNHLLFFFLSSFLAFLSSLSPSFFCSKLASVSIFKHSQQVKLLFFNFIPRCTSVGQLQSASELNKAESSMDLIPSDMLWSHATAAGDLLT